MMESRKRTVEHADEAHEGTKKAKESKELLPTLAAYGCRRGERVDMQDTHIMEPKLDLWEEKSFLFRSSLFAVFDGHAGRRAAEFCQKHMSTTVKNKLSKYSDFVRMTKSLKTMFTESYKEVDEGFVSLAKQNKPVWKDGTTATTMLILNNVIYVANIGDSKAVVARRKSDGLFSPVCLTVDHNPMSHEERMRIQKAGATVKDGRINGVIEVSRSIGDVPFKSLGVTCTPDLKKLTLTDDDLFAIIACDGLWKSFSNLEAVTFASEQLEIVKKTDLELEPNETRELAELRTVAEKLAAEAVRRKCGDNVSVILVKLNPIDLF